MKWRTFTQTSSDKMTSRVSMRNDVAGKNAGRVWRIAVATQAQMKVGEKQKAREQKTEEKVGLRVAGLGGSGNRKTPAVRRNQMRQGRSGKKAALTSPAVHAVVEVGTVLAAAGEIGLRPQATTMVAVAAAMRKVDRTLLLNRLGVVLGVVAGLLGWTGCGPEPIFAESRPIETEGGWSASDVKTFRFDITDTLSKHEFFIDLRHDQIYPFSNLYLFVDFDFPNGRQRRDTVLCELADARGAWLGTGSGPVVDHRIGFLSATAFPLSGAYEISVAHAMRRDPLPGVLDVGFRLERSPGQQD